MDRANGISLCITVLLHMGLAFGLGHMSLQVQSTAQTPMLIEVTLSGSSAPRSSEEGVKAGGDIIAAQEQKEASEDTGEAVWTAKKIQAWKDQRRREIMKELTRSQKRVKIGDSSNELRRQGEGLAEGRGAGDFGTPGSPLGTLSFTGAIATRGFQEPDFTVLKTMITEATQLRVTLIVQPSGEVKQAVLMETSGYPYVDQKAIELARKIIFDPLPPDWQQVDQQGVLTIKLKL